MKGNTREFSPPIRHFYSFIFLILLGAGTYAQPGSSVKGIVTDPEGAGLQGVSVNIKGASSGTTTDDKGHYSLKVSNPNVTLVFSYIGYEQE